jgi:hypothetical protein
MAPIQTPQRLNRLVEHIAKWPELSGMASKGSRGHPQHQQAFLFFSFLKGPAPVHQGFLRIALWTTSLDRVWLSRPRAR